MRDMTDSERAIFKALSDRPGEIMVSPDGMKIYAKQSDEALLIIQAEERNFNDMTPDEINDFLIKKLKGN
jgi:hypothetical protein